jgi:hypothetical protein
MWAAEDDEDEAFREAEMLGSEGEPREQEEEEEEEEGTRGQPSPSSGDARQGLYREAFQEARCVRKPARVSTRQITCHETCMLGCSCMQGLPKLPI